LPVPKRLRFLGLGESFRHSSFKRFEQIEDASVVEALKDVICGEQSLGMFVRGIFQPLVEGLAGIGAAGVSVELVRP